MGKKLHSRKATDRCQRKQITRVREMPVCRQIFIAEKFVNYLYVKEACGCVPWNKLLI
jgi:hypothetical protein